MRTVALFVAASVVWSSPVLADPDAPAPPLPALPATTPAPSEPAPPPPPTSVTPPAGAATAVPPNAPAEEEAAPELTYRPGPPTHRGFYLRASTGLADVSVTGTTPGGESASISGLGSQFGLAIGGSIAPGLAIGVDIEGASVTGTFTGGPQVVATTTYPGGSPSTTETLTGHATGGSVLLGGFVDWFPDRHGGWHLGGSLGVGVASIRDDAYHNLASGALGLGVSGGYNWWLGRTVSAGLNAFVLGSLTAHATDDGGNDTGYRLGSATFGLGGQILYY